MFTHTVSSSVSLLRTQYWLLNAIGQEALVLRQSKYFLELEAYTPKALVIMVHCIVKLFACTTPVIMVTQRNQEVSVQDLIDFYSGLFGK